MIEDALSSSSRRRLLALDTSKPTLRSGYVARDLLLFDSDAHVRTAAAHFIGRCRSVELAPALRDALFDDMPFVRHAVTVALARLHDTAAAPQLERHTAEDPIWWVRRAALVSLSRIVGDDAVPALRAALDDPFWRVRHAAVRALLRLSTKGGETEALLLKLGDPDSSRASGALTFLRRRLGLTAPAPEPAGPAKSGSLRLPADPDPAVVAARLEAGAPASLAFLVECLGDAHGTLRATASERLRRHGDARALSMAMLWLEEPRIPRAAQSVVALLDTLDPSRLETLLNQALSGGAVGAACWALSTIAERDDQDRFEATVRLAQSPSATVRRAAVAALGRLFRHAADPDRALAPLLAARRDGDADVARLAADALLATRRPEALELLVSEAPSADVLVRRLQVQAAIDIGHTERLQEALRDADPMARARAAQALASSDALDAETRRSLEGDQDPWIRMATLSAQNAGQLLTNDPHPSVRRRAFSLVGERWRSAVPASRDADPWLRSRSAALFDARSQDGLRRLLVLSRDPSKAVRAAAWETLDRESASDAAALSSALDALLTSEVDPEVRIAAYAVHAQDLGAAAVERLGCVCETEAPAVREWIRQVLQGATEPVLPETTPGKIRRAKLEAGGPRRHLGRSGLVVSPLAVSGAGDLSESALRAALSAGCNLFFWEPRYFALGRFLRRMSPSEALVIAGSFHASEAAIVADVERALRRLRRDTLDVFLLFWTRSHARLEGEALAALVRLKEQGKIRAAGFSTHDRELACDALETHPLDVLMVRHSAAHPGAEERLFPLAQRKGVGVLTFSALCYGRLLSSEVSASDAYRYSLAQPGVSAVISAPRRQRELKENLDVLADQTLSVEATSRLRQRGLTIRAESRDFNELLRRFPVLPADSEAGWAEEAESEDASVFPPLGSPG